MRRWDPLNERQTDTLRRIGDGDDLSRPEDVGLRTSARALQSRGLVEVSRRGGRWRASISAVGRFYLEHGHHPDHPQSKPKGSSPLGTESAGVAMLAGDGNGSSRGMRQVPETSVSQQRRADAIDLVRRLESEIERRVTISKPDEAAVAKWRRTIDYAKRDRLVPSGRRIEKRTDWTGDLTIELMTGDPPNRRIDPEDDSPPVPVPSQLRSVHPVIARLRDDPGRLVMPPERRRRCLLILQALAAEAERRGHRVSDEPVPEHRKRQDCTYRGRDYAGSYSRREGEIRIAIGEFSYTVTIAEETPQSLDPEKAARLVVEVTLYRSQGRQCRWADRKSWKVEDLLWKVLRELETRAVEDAQRKIEEERAAAERRRLWELAMADARREAHAARDAAALRDQAKRWRDAYELGNYCRALAERIESEQDDSPGVQQAREWLSWARAYATSINPLRTLPRAPEHPELTPDDLKPHLKDWSPYGPEKHRPW